MGLVTNLIYYAVPHDADRAVPKCFVSLHTTLLYLLNIYPTLIQHVFVTVTPHKHQS